MTHGYSRHAKFTDYAYNYLLGVALFAAILVWMMILVSHLSFRRQHGARTLPVRMPHFVWRGFNGRGLQGAAEQVSSPRAQDLPE